MLYADSPIDSSLLSLYIHQNYTKYCNDLDQVDSIMEWLSWVDSSGGESVSSFSFLHLSAYKPLPLTP